MIYITARSMVEDMPSARKLWTIEFEELTSQKFFPKNYEEVQEHLLELSEYRTPLPVPLLEEGYDWDAQGPHVYAVIFGQKPSGKWVLAILSQAVVFVMNGRGDTIRKITV